MTEAEALDKAWAMVRENDLERDIVGLKSVHLSRVSEVREVLGDNSDVREVLGLPELADTWYVSFLLKLQEGVVYQHPDDILISIDDRTGEPTLHWQM